MSAIRRALRRWHCRRQFNRLPTQWQRIFRQVGLDPDSKIAAGRL